MAELIVPPRPSEHPEHFEAVVRPRLTAQWISSLRARGVAPAQWKLEGFTSAASFGLVASRCPPDEPIVVLGKDSEPELLSRWFSAARAHPACVGFAVGRTIWWEPFLAHLAGASVDSTIVAIRDRYLDVVARWERAVR